MIDGRGTACEIAFTWMSLDFTDNKATVMPSGTKPLSEPVLTQIYVAIWHMEFKYNQLH